MPCKAKHEDDISRKYVLCSPKGHALIPDSFFEMDKMIIQNGGAVVELDDPKLTHVISDKRDDSRRRELISRTSKYDDDYHSSYAASCLTNSVISDPSGAIL